MKTKNFVLALFLLCFFFSINKTSAQTDSTSTPLIYVISTYNGGTFVGKIISQNEKEVLIETVTLGEVSIPRYQIREMKEAKSEELNASGAYIPEQTFATRYFLTTNGLPISKGESYSLVNIYGPEVHFGVGKNFGVGIMTSWVGTPIIGNMKLSVELGEKINLGLGVLLGTGSWALPELGIALPFTSLTFGDRRNNLNISAGYGAIWVDGESSGNALFSIGGMTRVGKSVSLVFDSFIVPEFNRDENSFFGTFALLIPGLRIQGGEKNAFQFGFAGVIADGSFLRVPFPMIQWYRKF